MIARIVIALLLMCSSAWAGNVAMLGGGVTTSCSTADSGGSHSILEEGFEGTGYENSAFWTETGTVDEDASTPASGPTGSCSHSAKTGLTAANNISHDFGSGCDTSISVSFWVYYETAVDNLSTVDIFSMSELSFTSFATLMLRIERSTNSYFRLTGTGSANSGTITTGNWYQINLKITQNSTCYMLVKDIGGGNVGSEVSVTGYNYKPQKLFIGGATSKSGSVYLDLLHVDGDVSNYAY